MPSKSTTLRSNQTAHGAQYGIPATGQDTLGERLERVALDRASTAERIVLETAVVLHAHVLSRASDWTWNEAGAELETALAGPRAAHGWRGPFALFVDALRCAWHDGAERAQAGDLAATPRVLLGDELGLWLWGREAGCEELVGSNVVPTEDLAPTLAPTLVWNGRPQGPGLRLPRREAIATRVRELSLDADDDSLRGLERGETILVPAFSETVIFALGAAQRAGLAPEAIVPEGAPSLDGRRMARRLASAGVKVRYVYDSLLAALLPRADRVWLGTEAVAPEGFLGRVGTRLLLEEAERRDVPSLLFATSDKLVPGGRLDLPAWAEGDAWLLWEHAPDGVRLEPQPYERVPHALVAGILTEQGLETAASLSLRRLRLECAPPCGTSGRSSSGHPPHAADQPRLPAELSGTQHDTDEA